MKGFKCDKCSKWVEGYPENKEHSEWMFSLKPIYSMTVSAKVILAETQSFDGQDLCKDCFIECLEMFIDVYKSRD